MRVAFSIMLPMLSSPLYFILLKCRLDSYQARLPGGVSARFRLDSIHEEVAFLAQLWNYNEQVYDTSIEKKGTMWRQILNFQQLRQQMYLARNNLGLIL